MAVLVGTVAMHKRTLCVRYETRWNEKPKATVVYWPIVAQRASVTGGPFSLENGYHAESTTNGWWLVSPAQNDRVTAMVYVQGSAQAIHSEIIDVPCPKVRAGVETRYHYGEWQKLLKKGWVRI